MSVEDAQDYSPEKIEYWLTHWGELQAAAEGGTGATGNGAGRGDRLALACMLADLERAADELPLHWTSTLQIFRLQSRARVWSQRRLTLEDVGVETAIARMARTLGWKP